VGVGVRWDGRYTKARAANESHTHTHTRAPPHTHGDVVGWHFPTFSVTFILLVLPSVIGILHDRRMDRQIKRAHEYRAARRTTRTV
jgi:hypothetical protein